jgi:hypothetical protein
MSAVSEAALRELRQRYNAAHAAYQSCARDRNEAEASGGRPSADLLTREANALQTLTEARAELLAAMAQD